MRRDQLIIQTSPFLFLKRLVAIQFFFALLPFLAALLLTIVLGSVSEAYNRFTVSRSVPYELLLTILATVLQLAVLAVAFTTWYLPRYVLDREAITYKGAWLMGSRWLANTAAITGIAVKQGRLARRVAYGTLVVQTSDQGSPVHLRDVPDPLRHAALIWELVEPPQSPALPLEGLSPAALVRGGENQQVEFKSSLLWDYRQQRANKELYLPVIKNLAAFMNATGGYVLIGVDDEGQTLGLEADLQALGKPNTDGFENVFNMAFNQMIGAEFRQYVDVLFVELEGRQVCLLRVRPSDLPVFVNHKGQESFYIRAGSASQPLSISQSARYIQQRFRT